MAGAEPTEEDIAWFRSTFHPVPKPALPDDCVEYSLYLISADLDASDDSQRRVDLRNVQKKASELQKRYLKDYIWQRQSFSLELVKEDGQSLLRGRTEYGDSVEDEWVVVWLLRELTKENKDMWIKITDSDGEFLLIEASGTLPSWLEPEVAESRVWINGGGLKIIKPCGSTRSSKRTTEKLSMADAKRIILNEPKRIMHSMSIEDEAFFRLRNYPKQIEENMHHALVRVPRKVAWLLKQKPSYIAPAVEAFYVRDPIALKPVQAKDGKSLLFPPDDLVDVSVRFPKVAYAQIRSQDFPVPPVWKVKVPSPSDDTSYAKVDSGMKMSCGFEMLLSDPQNQDRPTVREMKMLLDDLESGDETLPSDEEIAGWDQQQDDEKWLNISLEDLEGELANKTRSADGGRKAEFGDKGAQENLQRIVKQFEAFLNDDKAGLDGAGMFDEGDSDDDEGNDSDEDLESDDEGEDKEASFDEDEFTKMMREMMGMPPGVMKELMSGNLESTSMSKTASTTRAVPSDGPSRVEELDDPSDSEPDSQDLQRMMKQVEAELHSYDALDLGAGPSTRKIGAAQKIVDSKTKDQKLSGDDHDGGGDDHNSDSDNESDIDVNLMKNLLESLKSQAGTAGPTGNLMGMMGSLRPRPDVAKGRE